jgi:hypothetical protein
MQKLAGLITESEYQAKQTLNLLDRVKIIDVDSPFYNISGKIQAIASEDNPRTEGRYVVALDEFPKNMKLKAFRSSVRSFNQEQLTKL